LDVKPTLGFSINGDLGPVVLPGRSGSKTVSASLWDGIVGVKGRCAFGDERKWFVPFYLDVGTGQTQLTWQGAAGKSRWFSRQHSLTAMQCSSRFERSSGHGPPRWQQRDAQ